MLLRNRKTQGEEQNWCIILSPLRNEIDKKKVTQKITQVFGLSPEEATDLVANTPIILLDNLSRAVAIKLKEYFKSSGAELILTNDVFQKRKCYRTVWPEPPNLSFLHDWERANEGDTQVLHPDEALNEIRSLVKDESTRTTESDRESRARDEEEDDDEGDDDDLDSSAAFSSAERDHLLEEIERWRKECESLREEAERLKEDSERGGGLREDIFAESGADPVLAQQLEDKEKALKETRILLENAQERYESLKEEYREARSVYEEKIAQLSRENQRRTSEVSESVQAVQREKQVLNEDLLQKEALYQKLRDEHEKTNRLFNEKLSVLAVENEQAKRKINDFTLTLQSLQREKQILNETILQKETQYRRLIEENEKTVRDYEEKLAQNLREFEQWRINVKELAEKVEILQRTKEDLDRKVNELTEQVIHWHQKHDTAVEKHAISEKGRVDERTIRDKIENRYKDLERHQMRLVEDLETRNKELRESEDRYNALERQFLQMRDASQNQEKILESNFRQLETRERELETARRQVRELTTQMEQRDLVQKRNQLVFQLTEKEKYLKRLVQEQEQNETEIRQREDVIRKLLTEQESIEREIIEAKQAQRHLLEQTKSKERMTASRGKLGKDSAEEIPGFQEPAADAGPADLDHD